MTHRHGSFDSETYVLDHLAGVDLKREDTLHLTDKALYLLSRERPESDGTQKADLDPL